MLSTNDSFGFFQLFHFDLLFAFILLQNHFKTFHLIQTALQSVELPILTIFQRFTWCLLFWEYLNIPIHFGESCKISKKFDKDTYPSLWMRK